MSGAQRVILLSRDQAEFLKFAPFLPPPLVEILRTAAPVSDARIAIELSGDAAESFGEALTLRLAQVGFDADYALTDEGRMLEELIDRFFVQDS